MHRRSPARWLAPAALATCAVAVYLLVHEGGSSGGSGATATATQRTATKAATTPHRAKHVAKSYVVKAGDVLSSIAMKHGLTVEQLQQLNPGVDASALHPGQKLRLSR